MQAQLETLHMGAWPYQSYAGDPKALAFEDYGVQTPAARLYEVNSGAATLFASTGAVGVIDGSGIDVLWMNATASFETEPIFVPFDQHHFGSWDGFLQCRRRIVLGFSEENRRRLAASYPEGDWDVCRKEDGTIN